MIDFEGERVVITGAGGGVGRALVEVFSNLGAAVVACDLPGTDISDDRVQETHRFDLLDEQALDDSAARILDRGTPGAVISNAGWTRAEALDEVTAELLAREMALNFESAARISKALIPAMRHRPAGAAFVFVSSVNAAVHFGNPAYAAAKAALQAWMRAIATEEGRNGIRANAVVPGSINTPAWTHRLEEKPAIMKAVSRLYPLGRLVEPIEVAHTAAFLASPLASGITGALIPVDAGISAGNLPFLDQIVGSRA